MQKNNISKVIIITILYAITTLIILIMEIVYIRAFYPFMIIIFLGLLPIPIYYWIRFKQIDDLKQQQVEIKEESCLKIRKISKKYDYYCPHWLYQTNEKIQTCPNCNRGILSPTIN